MFTPLRSFIFLSVLIPATLSDILAATASVHSVIHNVREPFTAPPGECCVTGVKHEGVPVGTSVPIGPLNTYVSTPNEATNRVMVFAPDIHGPFYINNQLLMDKFASEGFTVLGPDYFFGDSVDNHPADQQMAWIASAIKPAQDAFPPWFAAVKEKFGAPGTTQYFIVGYCFGGPFSLQLGATDDVLAAAVAHPSSVTEAHFENITQPVLLSCAQLDTAFTLDFRRRAEDILIEKNSTFHIQVFSGVGHGFAVRGNLTNENDLYARDESARGVLAWFDRFSNAANAQ